MKGESQCRMWKRQFANVPTTSGSPMVSLRARRTSIGSLLNAKSSRHQLKAQAATPPPKWLVTQDWPLAILSKRQKLFDLEKTKLALPNSNVLAQISLPSQSCQALIGKAGLRTFSTST